LVEQHHCANDHDGARFEELDESGRHADRPKPALAIERIELGVSDGIIVAFRLDTVRDSMELTLLGPCPGPSTHPGGH
jgi:hypothetical protein